MLHRILRRSSSDKSVQQYWKDTSLLNIASEVNLAFSHTNTKAFVMGKRNLPEVLRMTMSLIEQRLPDKKDDTNDKNLLATIQGYGEYELNDHYETYAINAYYQWTRLEIQAATKALSWLQPLHEANCEESRLYMLLSSLFSRTNAIPRYQTPSLV